MSAGDRKLPDIETLRRRAVAYYKECDIQDRLQKFLNKLYLEQPDDIYGRLVEYFGSFEKVPTVTGLQFETTLDCDCNPAVKCNASAIVRNHDTVLGSAQVSAHKEIICSERLETEEFIAISEEILGKVKSHLDETLSEKVKESPLSTKPLWMLRSWAGLMVRKRNMLPN